MKKVYIVIKFFDEDTFNIIGVFDTKEKAEKCAKEQYSNEHFPIIYVDEYDVK